MSFAQSPSRPHRQLRSTIRPAALQKPDRTSQVSAAADRSIQQSDEMATTATIERIPDPAVPEFGAEWETAWEKNLLTRAMERVRGQIDERQFQLFDLNVAKGWPAADVAQ